MFERYTEKARRTIFFGRYEASQFGSPYIESEHLLLGILREDKALTNCFLRSNASVESIRSQIPGQNAIGQKCSTSVDLPLSDGCKRILAYAVEEADHLSHKFVGTSHLFLGVLREKDSNAAKLLNERGVFLDMAREQLRQNQGLPTGYTSQELLYNTAAETLILELRPAVATLPLPARLFPRHKEAESYERIGNPAEDVSYESPVTCEKHPLVVFNSLKWNKVRKGFDWDGVYSFNLSTKELVSCISREKLRFSEPHGRLSIFDLVSLSEDARTIYVKAEVVLEGGVVHHYLAKVDLENQEVSLLSRLAEILS